MSKPFFFCTCRLGAGSLLLWVPGNPDSWWPAGTEGGRKVGVWSRSCHDSHSHPLYHCCCWEEHLVVSCSSGIGRVLWSEFYSWLIPSLSLEGRYPLFCMQGVTFPAAYALWGKWAPSLERSLLIAISSTGRLQLWELPFFLYAIVQLCFCHNKCHMKRNLLLLLQVHL